MGLFLFYLFALSFWRFWSVLLDKGFLDSVYYSVADAAYELQVVCFWGMDTSRWETRALAAAGHVNIVLYVFTRTHHSF